MCASADSLPTEILLNIFSYLDIDDLIACRSVCHAWKLPASDWFLWQAQLHIVLSHHWKTIVCNRRPTTCPDFQNVSSVHPRLLYTFLKNYVLHDAHGNTLEEEGTIQQEGEAEDEFDLEQTSPSGGINRFNFATLLYTFVQKFIRPFVAASRQQSLNANHPRFAVFGPGFDRRATNKLFNKLVDTRTKSFEPVNMITGSMGFGAGLTLRLFAQAQQTVYTRSAPDAVQRDMETSSNVTTCLPSCSGRLLPSPTRKQPAISTAEENVCGPSSTATMENMFCSSEDMVFDLLYLYSLQGHLCHKFKDQLDRLLSSRLFTHSCVEEEEMNVEELKNLTATEQMTALLKSVDGLIYAIDGRETESELKYLNYELSAVIRAFPPSVAQNIPIVILYIMPKEDINLDCNLPMRRPTTLPVGDSAALINRDSYSGTNYTLAWHGSLLLPVANILLFDLNNPWRLQKCSSNDIHAIIETVMWLSSKRLRNS